MLSTAPCMKGFHDIPEPSRIILRNVAMYLHVSSSVRFLRGTDEKAYLVDNIDKPDYDILLTFSHRDINTLVSLKLIEKEPHKSADLFKVTRTTVSLMEAAGLFNY